jgi:hypothetical protein
VEKSIIDILFGETDPKDISERLLEINALLQSIHEIVQDILKSLA